MFSYEKNIVAFELNEVRSLFSGIQQLLLFLEVYTGTNTYISVVNSWIQFRVIILSKLFKTHCQDRLHKPICLNSLPLNFINAPTFFRSKNKPSWVIHQQSATAHYVHVL